MNAVSVDSIERRSLGQGELFVLQVKVDGIAYRCELRGEPGQPWLEMDRTYSRLFGRTAVPREIGGLLDRVRRGERINYPVCLKTPVLSHTH